MTVANSLSLTLIVKNEEVHLNNALATAAVYADEIVIVDTGSTDKTKDIARQYTDKIYDFQWCDDLSLARNYGVERCTKDLVMWLDADDVVPQEIAQKIQELKQQPIDWDVLYMPYHYHKDAAGNPTVTHYRERIFRNRKGYHFIYPIHECLHFPGETKCHFTDKIFVVHNKLTPIEDSLNRNERILLKAIEKEEYKTNPRLWFYLARDTEVQKSLAFFKRILSEFCSDIQKSFHSEIWVGYGKRLMEVGRYDEAMAAFGQAMVLYPLWREPFFFAGQALCHQKRYQEAVAMFFLASKIPTPKSSTVIYDVTYYDGEYFYDWAYYAYECLGNRQKMHEIAELALRKNPHSQLFADRLRELSQNPA